MNLGVARIRTNAPCSKIKLTLIILFFSVFLALISTPAHSAPQTSPTCAARVGAGGTPGASTHQAGHGCVIIKYNNGSSDVYETFSYTGSDQSWTSPASTTTLTFYLVGAGGGAVATAGAYGPGAAGGFSTATYSASGSTGFKIIVGQGGYSLGNVTTYGGGGAGGGASGGYGSGGGRSAIRLASGASDLITAGGGGGGGYNNYCAGGGGGDVGANAIPRNNPDAKGGSQSAGGVGGYSINGLTGNTGAAYIGGSGRDESGGGGGGYFGGGGGGDNSAGGGGSGFIGGAGLTSASTVAGTCTAVGNSSALAYTITYDGNGKTSGTVPTAATINAFASTTLASNSGILAKTNFNFAGWNTAADGSGSSYTAGQTGFYPNGDTTLYAQWSSTITYNGNGKTSGTVPAAQTVIGSTPLTLAANSGTLAITRGVFLGWNTAADGSGTSYTASQAGYVANGNITLYAKWGPATCTPNAGFTNCQVFPMDANNQTYTIPNTIPIGSVITAEIWGAGGGGIAYSPTGGGGGGYSKVAIEVTSVGETITVVVGSAGSYNSAAPTYGGGGGGAATTYGGSSGGGMSGIFSGLGLTQPIAIAGGGGGASPSHAIGIAGGGGAAGNNGGQGTDVTISGAGGTQSAGGAGASNLSSCSGLDATAGSKYQGGFGGGGVLTTGIEGGGGGGGGYYGGGGGRCQISSGPVQNGGGGGGSGYIDATRATIITATDGGNGRAATGLTGGTTSTQYVSPIGQGGGVGTVANAAAGNGLVVIQWSTSLYTISFNANTGSTTATPIAQTYSGTTITLPDAASTTKIGYTFVNWNTAANGTGTSYAPGATYTPTSTLTLYAIFTGNAYAITFDPNAVTDISGTMANQNIVAGTPITLTTKAFTRVDYTFAGWNTAANGSGTAYTNIQSVTLYANTTLYAQWTVITYAVTFNLNLGSGTMANQNFNSGEAFTLRANAYTRTGYVFYGWNTVALGTGTSYANSESVTLHAATTLYAQWAVVCTVTTSYLSGYIVNTFSGTGLCYWAVPAGVTTADVLLVGAGGGGASNLGGGGGGGQLISSTGVGISGGIYIYVGAGGVAGTGVSGNGTNNGSKGGDSYIDLGSSKTTALGGNGGRGRYNATNGVRTGGYTGGGGTWVDSYATQAPNTGSGGAGVDGGTGTVNGSGGGGGAGGTGYGSATTAAGGIGLTSSITGTSIYYGGGGGGTGYNKLATYTGFGGLGGGGQGGSTSPAATSGTNGLGGGGGADYGGGTAGTGGSGVVIIRYSTAYTVTFNGNSATSGTPSVATVTQTSPGATVTLASQGSLARATFAGWNTLANGTGTNYAAGATYEPIGNVTLYAQWNSLITFDGNSATTGTPSIASVLKTTVENTTLATVGTLARTGYTFSGWNTLANGTGTTYATGLTTYTPVGNITLYAKWVGNSYTVTFGNTPGTTGSTDPSGVMPAQTFTAGTPFNLSTSAWYRTGYSLAGWSTVSGNGSPIVYAPRELVTLYGNTTIYTQWTANVYTVSFNANSGTGAATNPTVDWTFGTTGLAVTSSYNAGNLARTGYTFAGWSATVGGAAVANPYSPIGAVTLYARWTANSYTLSYDANGGTTNSSVSIVAGTPVTLSTTAGTRTGYTLAGWNTSADGSGTSYAGTTSQTFYATTTLYGLWSIAAPGVPSVSAVSAGNTTVAATVTGVAASGTSIGPATSYTVQAYDSAGVLLAGKTCTVLASASPLSCTVSGLTNDTIYKFKATATNTNSTTAVSASFSGNATPLPFVVTYNANSGSVTPATANYNLGTPLLLVLPTRSGYTFSGWYTAATGGSLLGLSAANYSPSATVTIYAQWTPITYIITYNGNGSNGGSVASDGSFAYASTYSIAARGSMSKSGYSFTGWTTASNGSGTLYAHASDLIASSTATYSSIGNLSLYAKWTADIYTITYSANGGSGAGSRASDSYTYATTALTLPTINTLAKDGYTFSGWSETNSGQAVTSPYTPTQTRTLYAVWTGLTYSISYNNNGGSGTISDTTYTTGNSGITLNDGSAFSRTGYNFTGWSNFSGTPVTSPYTTTSNVTLYATWSAKSIAITYAQGTGDAIVNFPTNTTTTFGANYQLSATVDSSKTIGGDPYAFAGWHDAATSAIYKPGDYYRIASESGLTFTAQWVRLYEVTYNFNGGTAAGADTIHDTECPSNLCTVDQSITLNGNPNRTGFNFTSWVDQNGNAVADTDLLTPGVQTTVISTRYIFYATWTPLSFTITYNKGTGSELPASSQTGDYGAVISLATSSGYTLAGSVFTGWRIGSITYPAGAFYTLGTDTGPVVTATAQFANNTFKIFYNTNGSTSGSAPAATSALAGASINLALANGFGRDGFTFDGWSNGTITNEANYSTTMGSTNTTLIAQWKVAAPVAPTFTAIEATDSGATVTINAGAGGGTATSFRVTSSPSGGSCTINAPTNSCAISSLVNGTIYTFSAVAVNSTATSSAVISSSVTPAVKPDAPTGLVVTRGDGSASISFTAPVNTGGPAITSYTLTSSPNGRTCTVNAPATTCTVTGLTNGTAYTFTATASNGIYSSDASSASSSATPATNPGAPTSVSATSSSPGTAVISFVAPVSTGGSALTGYTITSSPAGGSCNAAAGETTCTVTGLTNGTAYTFSAVATNDVGNSLAGTSSSVTPAGAASAPTSVTGVAGDSSVTVSVSGAAANGSTILSYTVSAYDSTGTATGATCTITPAATSCLINGLTNGNAYTFKATTTNGVGTSSLSSASSAVTPAGVPIAPTSLNVTPGNGKITVSWAAATSNGSAVLSYTVTSSPGGFTCTINAPATTCDVTGLAAATDYTFTVKATNVAGESLASSSSAAASVNSASSAPLNVLATPSNAAASVSWSSPADSHGSAIQSYLVTAYDNSGAPTANTCATNASTFTCTVTGLTNGSNYTFKVTATNGIGTSVASAASSIVIPSTVPQAPAAIIAIGSDSSAIVSFTAPTNNGGSAVLSYTVTASDGTTATGSSSPITVTGLANSTQYTFTVKANNANGPSSASLASSSVTPVPLIAPSLTNNPVPSGNPYVGSTLTSGNTYSASPEATLTYQWKSCNDLNDFSLCTSISGATSPRFIPTSSELGKYIVVQTTAINGVSPNSADLSAATFIIQPEIIYIAPISGLSGEVTSAFALSTSATGGVSPFTYAVGSGSLPAGVTLNTVDGSLAGTPTTSGSFTFTLVATDANTLTKTISVTLSIAVDPVVAAAQAAAAEAARIAAAQAAAAEAARIAAAQAAAAEAARIAEAAETARIDAQEAAAALAARLAAEELAAQQAAAEAARIAAQQAAAEALAAQQTAEALAAQQAAAEAARIAAQQAAEALAAQQAAEALAAQQAAAVEAARIAAQQAAAEKAAAEALAAQQAAEALAAQQAAAVEAARIAAQQAAAEKAAAEALAAQQAAEALAARLAAEALAAQQAEEAKIAAEALAALQAAEAKATQEALNAAQKAFDNAQAKAAASAIAKAAADKAAIEADAVNAKTLDQVLTPIQSVEPSESNGNQSIAEIKAVQAAAKKAVVDTAKISAIEQINSAVKKIISIQNKEVKISVNVVIDTPATNNSAAEIKKAILAAKAVAETLAKKELAAEDFAKKAAKYSVSAEISAAKQEKVAIDAISEAQALSSKSKKASAEVVVAEQLVQDASTALAKILSLKLEQTKKIADTKDIETKVTLEAVLAELSQKADLAESALSEATKLAKEKAIDAAKAKDAADSAVSLANQKVSAANTAAEFAQAKAVVASNAETKASAAKAAYIAGVAAIKVITNAITPSKNTSEKSNSNNAKATINGLKPGQKIKVTIKVNNK